MYVRFVLLFALLLLLSACAAEPLQRPAPSPSPQTEVATFAGGCFWAIQRPFDNVEGVLATRVGYSGGSELYPMFDEVTRGMTSHLEVIEVTFDPAVVSYEELLEVFWRHIDPTDDEGQFADRGPNYRTAIFYHDERQKRLAVTSQIRLEASGVFDRPIVTDIRPAEVFWEAVPYHQDYYMKKPDHFNRYLRSSGRPAFLLEVWGEHSL